MRARALFLAFALGLMLLPGLTRAADPVDPANAVWSLTLNNGLDGANQLALEVTTRFGLFATARALGTGKFQFSPALAIIEAPHLRGDLNARINDKPCTYTLDVTFTDDKVTGTYAGTVGDVKVTGEVSGIVAPLVEATKLTLVRASFFGTAEDDDLQAAAVGPDGSIYLVGNTGAPRETAPNGVTPRTLGTPAAEPRCGCGFVARLSPDGSRVLAYTQLAQGIAILTSAVADANGVYVSGYASDALASVLAGKQGLITTYPLTEEMRLIREGKITEANGLGAGAADPLAKNPGLGRYGAPCVLRLPADISTVQNGTYLEGWQQVWGKFRVFARPFRDGYQEYCWQPVELAVAKNGDIVVSHDGGYFRLLTDKDRAFAATTPNPAATLKKLGFYDVPDWLSRLSPDLTARGWRQAIYTPATDPEVAKLEQGGWTLPHYSSPRTLRMRMDADDHVFICGWSASATKSEPYWTPYLWKMDGATGALLWKAYAWDPMSGADHRMNGNVADTAVGACAVEDNGNVLAALHSDGGNNVIGMGPRGHEGVKPLVASKGGGYNGGLVHFNGQIQRVDTNTRDGLGGSRTGHSAWITEIAPLKDGYILGIGRWNVMNDWSRDAWFTAGATGNPNAYLRLFSPEFDTLYTTVVPGIWPFASCRLGPTTYVITGRADNAVVPTKDAIQPASAGKSDGYFMIVEAKP